MNLAPAWCQYFHQISIKPGDRWFSRFLCQKAGQLGPLSQQFWYVYILTCSDGSIYTGCTNNLEDRIKRHNLGQVLATKNILPVEIVTYMENSASLTTYGNLILTTQTGVKSLLFLMYVLYNQTGF